MGHSSTPTSGGASPSEDGAWLSENRRPGLLKVSPGVVDKKPDGRSRPTVHPTMSHFFYMDEKDQTKARW
jgi:hypothetical protein